MKHQLKEDKDKLRKCKKCKKEYPQLVEYFWKNSAYKDGLEHTCKECSHIIKDEFYNKQHRYRNSINYITNTQICKDCKKELPLTPEYFWRRNDKLSGYDRRCKECHGKWELTKIYKSQRLLDNNIWVCSSCGRELELTKINFYKRTDSPTGFAYRCKNCVGKDPSRYDRKSDSENLKQYLKETLNGIKQRARKKNLNCDLTLEFLLDLYHKQNELCAISGLKMTHALCKGRVKTNISVDRIIPSIGYIKDNVQLLCNIINVMKSDMTIDELRTYCTLILQ